MPSADAAPLVGLVDAFPRRTILVLGDLVADEYIHCRPLRVSREAPVLILRHLDQEFRLGAAANACHNLHALGARVIPVGVLGSDRAGDGLRRLFTDAGIPTEGIVTDPGRTTPVKTRIMAGGSPSTRQQVVRVDREPEGGPSPAAEEALNERFATLSSQVDAVVLSDYGYGTITPHLIARARDLAQQGTIVTADSRYDLLRFERLTAATPSEPEVEALLGLAVDGDKTVEQAGWHLLARLGMRLLLVTRGPRGLVLFERDGPATFVPIHGSDQALDVTGAGDTVIATFTLALAAGAVAADAARLANYAGGVVVMKRGTSPVTRAELRATALDDAPPAGRQEGHGDEGHRR